MEFIDNLSKQEFENFSTHHPLNNIFQTTSWATTKSNWTAYYIGVKDNGKLIGSALVLVRAAALGFKFGYCPRGPLMDFNNDKLLAFFLEHLKVFAKKNKILLLKFDPHYVMKSLTFEEKDQIPSIKNDELVNRICQSSCRFNGYTLMIEDSIQPRIQLNYPIGSVYDERIPKKTTKKIRASYNKGIEIREEHSVNSLVQMVKMTEHRHQIHLRNEAYFQTMLDAFKDEAVILSAYHEGILVSSCLLVSSANTTEILYSGYDDNYKHTNSTYPLREQGIKWASEHHKTNFYFGGVEGTLDDGLTMFKQSFNPLIDVYLGEFDLLPYPIISRFIAKNFKSIKKKINM